jgi:hypothetical protein
VTCGREENCCGAKEREQETDCDAEDARDSNTTPWGAGGTGTPNSMLLDHYGPSHSQGSGGGSSGDENSRHSRTPSPQLGPGYERHEIEGIGGVVKRKLVRMVRVGACVPEFADERTKHDVLGHEASGRVRSWCGWCWRVVPSNGDIEAGERI